jgi:hypothetical protein
MTNVSLIVVDPESAKNRTVLAMQAFPPRPIYDGDGETDLLCGKCAFVIARGVGSANQFQDVLLACNSCGSLNASRV